ncbi:hypothetical protein TWF481_010976 [Arthrobotrys musiformis]|uniref:F-box domain-containing protein n=1 Tax=Arthrobotrys musiformis TaxID=47236 RepID=A0AAV9VYT8_9PEZI
MLNIIEFPNEILLSVLEKLPCADLAQAKLVCKHFHVIGELVSNLEIKFYVDIPNHQGWKLIRCILADNSLGTKISRVSVHWRRRDVNRRKTLTKYWEWTEEEKKRIGTVCSTWALTHRTRDAITAGANSEALLPLLLCLAPRIKTFELGKEKVLPILFEKGYYLERRVLQAFNSCLSEEDQGSTVGTRKELADGWGFTVSALKHSDSHRHHYRWAIEEGFVKLIEKHIPELPWPSDWDCVGLWLEENLMTLSSKLPWFKTLDNVETFCKRRGFVNGKAITFGHFCTDPERHTEDELYPPADEDKLSSDGERSDSEDEPFPSDEHGDTSDEEEDDYY